MAAKLSELSDAELVAELSAAETSLVDGRFALALSRLENTASLRDIRKRIARLQTEIRAREIANGLGAGSLASKFKKTAATAATTDGKRSGFLKGVVDRLAAAE